MFELVEFKKEHVAQMVQQSINADIRRSYESGLADQLEMLGGGVTYMVRGQPMACGGVIKLWEGRGCIWSVFNENAKGCFVPVFRGMKRYLKEQLKDYRRLEIAVPMGFEIGHKRAKLLGFELECPKAEKYLPDGTDCALYALVRKDAV